MPSNGFVHQVALSILPKIRIFGERCRALEAATLRRRKKMVNLYRSMCLGTCFFTSHTRDSSSPALAPTQPLATPERGTRAMTKARDQVPHEACRDNCGRKHPSQSSGAFIMFIKSTATTTAVGLLYKTPSCRSHQIGM